jgi:hypothetical protein
MKPILRVFFIIAPASLLVGSCASTNTACQNPATPDQVLDCANQHFATTVAEGGVTGAVLGGVAGAILSRNRAEGAALGAALGGALGTAAGYAVARRNFEQQQTEQNLNELIASAQQDALTAQQAAEAARQRAANAQERVRQLTAQYHGGQISLDKYQAELASYRDTEQKTQQMINSVDTRAAEIRQDAARAGPGAAVLEHQASSLDAAKTQLTQSYNDLVHALAGA